MRTLILKLDGVHPWFESLYATFKISRIGSVGSANCEPADSSSQSFPCCFLGNVFDVHSDMHLFLNMCSYYYY